MAINASVGNRPADVFKTFPEFSKLTLADRTKYEALIKDLPPYSDYAFPTLMNWWNTLDSCAISMLNGNLVISYWIPGMDSTAGISLIGTKKVDESICMMLDHLKASGEEARLVHVPEFVISHIEHPEMFAYIPERDADEYILAVDRYYPVKHAMAYRRHRIRKFTKATEDSNVTVKSLDLSRQVNRDLLVRCADTWQHERTINNTVTHSYDAMLVSINDADYVGTENVCVFIDGQLQAFLLYSLPSDKRYAIFSHLRLSYAVPHLMDYVIYACAEWMADRGISFMNIDADLGVPVLREFKLALGPYNYFRKYIVKSASDYLAGS